MRLSLKMILFQLRQFFFSTLILVGSHAFSQTYQPTVEMRIPVSPEISVISGKPTVYYEIYLTSFSTDTMQFNRLEVFNQHDSALLHSIENESWNSKAAMIGLASKERNKLSPGQTMVLYLEFALPKTTTQLYHKLSLKTLNKKETKSHLVTSGIVSLSKKPAVVLGAPLKSGPWAAVYSADWERGHRRVIYTIDGKARIPGRHAIDFILLNDRGQFTKGDDNRIQNWFGYSAEVLAVKDGIVLSTKNDFPESATLSDHVESTADKAAGNYVSIDIGDGKIVFYEHLKPGSVKVKPGQRVKKGEVIAALGFTGQTTGPHLHFHVADANATLGAEGLPFEFEKFTHLGTYFKFDEFGKLPWTEEKNPNRSFINKERPGSNSVIRF